MRPAALALLVAFAAPGCGEKEPSRKPKPVPDEPTATLLAREHIERSPAIVAEICGSDDAKPSSLDVSVVKKLGRAVVFDVTAIADAPKRCEASAVVVFEPLADTEPTGFVVSRVEVYEVRTKGHERSRAAPEP